MALRPCKNPRARAVGHTRMFRMFAVTSVMERGLPPGCRATDVSRTRSAIVQHKPQKRCCRTAFCRAIVVMPETTKGSARAAVSEADSAVQAFKSQTGRLRPIVGMGGRCTLLGMVEPAVRLMLLLALHGCASTTPPRAGASPAREAALSDKRLGVEIDKAITLHVQDGFSGVVLVARAADVIVFRGYGSQQGKSVAADDRFWLASTGKQFVSAAIFKLVEQRKVDLDDRISRFFPSAPADKSGITVRQLLTHTSGLGQSYVSEGLSDRGIAVSRMLSEPLKGLPGTEFRYSNNNTQLAAAIVEVASGVPYPDFVSRFLWSPAGLTETGFAGPRTSPTVNPIRGVLPQRLRKAYWGEQGVFSTATDLFNWHRALRSNNILTKRSVEEMLAPAVRIGEGHATPGWFRGATQRGTDFVFVRGNEDFGANSLLYVYPARATTIIVLTHAGNADEQTSWSRRILQAVEQVLGL